MNKEGLLLLGEVKSGNPSDMTFNGHWIRQVRERLSVDGDEFLLYVADSSVVTTENLELLRENRLKILSRLPERFALAEELMEKAQAAKEEEWQELGIIREGQGKKAASYRVWETEAELSGEVYRFMVVSSSNLNRRHLKALGRRVEKEVAEYEKMVKKMKGLSFCEKGLAEGELNHILRSWSSSCQYHRLEGRVESYEERLPYPNRGRPRRGEEPPEETRYRICLELVSDEERKEKSEERCGMFVLISSLLDREEYPARQLLDTYKGQHMAERALRFIKSPCWVGAYCLKKPERVVAFGYVVLMAAIVYTLLERQVRKALVEPLQEAVRGLNNRPTLHPTAYAILVILSGILVFQEVCDRKVRFRLNLPLTENQQRILQLAGFSETIYHQVGLSENSPGPPEPT